MKPDTWKLKTEKVPQNLKELGEILLKNRRIKDKQVFFYPKHPEKISLDEIGISKQAIKILANRVKQAKEKQKKVIIFGDYDVDGISATAIMWQVLYAYGLNVAPFIPMRDKHGYGLSLRSLPDLLTLEPDLVITVDNGIVAYEAAEALAKEGVDLIITDHHQAEVENSKLKALNVDCHSENLSTEKAEIKNVEESEPDTWIQSTNESARLESLKPDRELAKQTSSGQTSKRSSLPTALAVVHTTQLCGASVAWMVARELADALSISINVGDLLDLAGMATIADQVPLLYANRSFAYHGLKQLKKTTNVGLRALMKQAGVKSLMDVDETTVGFRLAPRINALGRLAHGLDALRLLCSTSPTKAQSRAQTLGETNSARQTLTTDAYLEAQRLVKLESLQEQKVIIVASETFHEGVVGLIAGRLVEEFERPALAISLSDDGMAKGSARSLPGVHITNLLRQVREELVEVGGHPMAAGFGLKQGSLESFKIKLTKLANETIDESLLTTAKTADAILPSRLLSLETVDLLEKFRPFGMGNPEPLFVLKNMQIVAIKVIGNGQKHLKLLIKPKGSNSFQPLEALWWGARDRLGELEVGQTVDMLVKVEKNSWNGKEKLQVVIKRIN